MIASSWTRWRQGLVVLGVATVSLIGGGSARAQSPDLTWRAIQKQNDLLRAVDARLASLENLTIYRQFLDNRQAQMPPWTPRPVLAPTTRPQIPGQTTFDRPGQVFFPPPDRLRK
jgi:hypothetical protein